MKDTISILRDCGVQPTPQRISVVKFILNTSSHPSADQVLEKIRVECPTVSRATVYNTLNLLVQKGLVKTQVLKGGTVVFDANVNKHHHFIDLESGEIYDIPWEALTVRGESSLKDFEVSEMQVILKGRKRK
jgi:Fe2+ or Zn2+ uptake regulation protein